MDARWLAVGVGAIALTGAACRSIDKCAENGAPCGGNPVGQWTVASSCQDPTAPAFSVSKRTYLGQPITTAGQRPPEATSTDWCADLVYGGPTQGIVRLNLPHDTSAIIGGYLYYADDHSYGAFITNTSTSAIDFSSSCLTRFGYTPTCGELSVAFGDFARLQGGIKLPPTPAGGGGGGDGDAGAGAPAREFCVDDGSGGCRCVYLIEADAAGSNLTGTWNASGSVLTHFEGSLVLPSQVDYCVDGDRLTLWGHARTNVLDIIGAPGARTINLTRIACGNGLVEHGEDCDPPDGVSCDPTCHRI